MGNTYPLGTTEQEMIDEFHASVVIQKDLDGKTVTHGDPLEHIWNILL